MQPPFYLRVIPLVAIVLTPLTPAYAKPALHISIEWATANSERVIVGNVLKVESIDEHDIVTVEIQRTLRGQEEPKQGEKPPQLTFVTQKYCSSFAKGWLQEKQTMILFLGNIKDANHRDNLPQGYDWVLQDNGMGNNAVLLKKTERTWSGTMDAFTQNYEHLTDADEIIKYIVAYASTLPETRIEKSEEVKVPQNTSAYEKVWPREYPGNAFYLRIPVVEK